MKKIVPGLIATFMAVGFSAFTMQHHAANTKTLDALYWYRASDGSAFPGNPQAEPSSDCTQAGIGCARGFTEPQSDPLHVTPQETRKLNQ